MASYRSSAVSVFNEATAWPDKRQRQSRGSLARAFGEWIGRRLSYEITDSTEACNGHKRSGGRKVKKEHVWRYSESGRKINFRVSMVRSLTEIERPDECDR